MAKTANKVKVNKSLGDGTTSSLRKAKRKLVFLEGAKVLNRKQRKILSLFGTIEYDPAYDYKRDRQGRERLSSDMLRQINPADPC